MSQVTRVLVLVGVAVALGGFVLGMVPVESAGSACGSSFVRGTEYHDALVGSMGCSDVRSAHLPWAWALITMGGVLAGVPVVAHWLRNPAVKFAKPTDAPADAEK